MYKIKHYKDNNVKILQDNKPVAHLTPEGYIELAEAVVMDITKGEYQLANHKLDGKYTGTYKYNVAKAVVLSSINDLKKYLKNLYQKYGKSRSSIHKG